MSKYSPKRKTPCKECPFRRESARGWLGADNPEHFLDQTLRDADMPCHMEIDYTDKEWRTTQEPDAAMCAGAQIFQKNWMKMPRDPAVLETWNNVNESPHVFATPEEFLIHHMHGIHEHPVRSDSHWWKAAVVNAALDFVDFAKIVHIVNDDDEDMRGVFLGINDVGDVVRAVADPEGKSFGVAEWVKEWFHGKGEFERLTAPAIVFEAVIDEAVKVGPLGEQSGAWQEEEE